MSKVIAVLLLSICSMRAAGREPVKISAWYWLNSAPRSEWARDFKNMGDLGFTHVALCWGLDAAAWLVRPDDTTYALDAARNAGLGAYFIVWHPTHNSLPRRPEFQQVTAAGHLTFAFNTFHERWRQTQWKEYLQNVARRFARHPAFAGYIFDDSFMIGGLDRIDGPQPKPDENFISYGDADIRRYGKQPPKHPGDPRWAEWTQARSNWWAAWASDTMRFIREVDPNPQHEVYVEDTVSVFTPHVRDAVGLDFGKVAQPWDAVGAYTAPHWDDTPESGKRAADYTLDVLQKTRSAAGVNKKIIYTFWVANITELRNPGPAKYPTVSQIRDICDTALKFGIRHLDMYGYRIGDPAVTEQNWPEKRPPAKGPYPLTGQYPKKHLYDRTELHDGLRAYLRSLRTK